ncbi:TonB-dependent receptor [Sphingomonas sp. NFR15]|uniref:TonB-dependent receptor domain-containing protein n=1 Tax=Sphingomonas sp. NFR15 TaxID=1566282 RepID=UPI000891AC96|nr:TonB-dependent receptor [Sphingomonas sp. NFR15]SDA36287.1 Outer membrane receptor proteins, mostly Fe transport [Sphingomonas sp. NFR15]
MSWRLCGAIAAAVALGTPAASRAASALLFDIPGGDLADALMRFARQSGRQILFAPAQVRGLRATAVHKRLDPDRAIARLLSGTGFRARPAPGGAYLLEAVPRPAPAPPRAIAPADIAQIADIVVVGTPGGGSRRQEAAFAVTTANRAAIDQLGAPATADVLRLMPGLTVETSGGKNGANIFVRGYPSGGDAEYVTFQTEGVPYFPPATLSFLENSQLYRIDGSVQRVEAVRGGTGALLASGQPGATINIIQREGDDHLAGLVKTSVIDDGEGRGDAYVSGPLGQRAHFMIGGYYSRGDGIRSPGFAADRGGQITANLRRDLARGSVLVFARYLDDRSQWLLPIPVEQTGRSIGAYPGFDPGTGTLAGPDTRTGTRNDGNRYDLNDGRGARIVNLGTNVELRFGDTVTLRDKASWLAGHADTTGLVSDNVPPESAAAYAARLGGAIGMLVTTADGRAVSPAQAVVQAGIWTVAKRIDALVNDATLEWATGVSKATVGVYATEYGSRDHWDIGNALLLTAQPQARRLDLTLANGTVVTRDGFASGSSFLVDARYRGSDLAFYGVEEVTLGDHVRLDGGVRHQRHSVDGSVRDTRAAGSGGLDGDPRTLYDNDDIVFGDTRSQVRYRGGAWSWTFGGNVDVTRRFGGFTRFSRGTSFPFFDNVRDGITVAPRIDTIEGGVKLTGPLSLFATVFRNSFQGLATTVIAGGAPIASIGGARATGVEVDGTWRVAKPLSVAFTGTWLDARYRRFFTDAGRTDLSGNRVQRQPVWQWRVTPSWDFEVAARKAGLFATLAYMGDRWSDVQNQQLLPGFLKWDAGLTFDPTDRLRLQATADNITNAIGLTEGNPRALGTQAPGAIFARPIPGRSVNLSASFRF